MSDLFEEYWRSLPVDLFTSQSKGSKAQARTEWVKLKVDANLYKVIIDYTKEKESIDRERRRTGDFVSPWKHVCRLLKYRYFEDDLPKTRYKKNPGAKDLCGCGEPIEHSSTFTCWDCYTKRFGNTKCGWTA